jgi:hypothetical protein
MQARSSPGFKIMAGLITSESANQNTDVSSLSKWLTSWAGVSPAQEFYPI